jgi:hypothetical protein
MASRVYVSTRQFELSHGHRPRGCGHWAFTCGDESELHWFNGLYSRACWTAKHEAKILGFDLVTAQP